VRTSSACGAARERLMLAQLLCTAHSAYKLIMK
jgi:hypothetical protein